MRIIIDAMSGDNAPEQIVLGALDALSEQNIQITLVGERQIIEEIVEKNASQNIKQNIEIVDADDAITMEDDPMSIIKEKRHSSMGISLDLLKDGKGDAVISAGNTGALLCGATLIVKRISGIKRAALASILPIERKLLVDSGANVEVKPEYLFQFALMGSIYMNYMYGVDKPRIALLNNGAEAHKGTPIHTEVYKMLNEAEKLNFVGNVEGRELYRNVCDVVVSDGFSGNIALKTIEGSGNFFGKTLKEVFGKNLKSKIAYLLLKDGIANIKTSLDYKQYGGAPFLGISKTVVKAHGSSDRRSIMNTVKQAVRLVESNLVGEVERRIGYADRT